MKVLYYITIYVFILSLTSCFDSTDEVGIQWIGKSKSYVTKGIDVSHKMSEVSLDFLNLTSEKVSTESNVDWLIPEIQSIGNNSILVITATYNPSDIPREGVVQLIVGRHVTKITVKQAGVPSAISDKDIYYISSDGGDILIKVNTTGKLSASFYPEDSDNGWAKITNVTSGEKNGEYLISVSVGKNSGFGRLAGLELKVDGEMPFQGLGPSIIQEPAPFGEEITIKTKKVGLLPVLLGNNINNLSRIRKLTIEGGINGLDFEVFKQILSIKDNNSTQQPISFDLLNCDIMAGNKNPYNHFGYRTDFAEFPDVFLDMEIPMGVFTGASNLQSIILPSRLKYIGRKAFMGCTSLQTIVIPDFVEEINSKAFFNCSSLKDIKLSSKSNLLALGNQVFTTGSKLNDLYLPYTLTTISIEAFLGCSVTGLHLRWIEPLEVTIVPETEGCILYVPKNTKDLYSQTRNWSKFKNIVEEETFIE